MSLAGRQLGRYRLLELLGTGGMSMVYRGLDTALQREVAVKVLHPHLALQLDARRRLEREARAVARLHHPGILEVFDVSDPEMTDAFLVTELVRGETLRAFAEREPVWPPELAAVLVHQVASALAHAHQAGVVHRDLKPENVMLRDDGVLKLMDFGIARVLDPAERMTQTGALVGSPAYMAPEVIDGQAAGPESDVFALGTMLYWLWTGRLPFAASTTPGTLKRVLEGVYADPRGLTAGLSDALAAVLDRCLEREPDKRYPTAAGLEQALAAALADVGLTDPAAELAAFHAAPGPARDRLVDRLVTSLDTQAESALAAGRTALALARVDQVLGLRPEDAVARAVLSRAQRQDRLRRRRGRLQLGALAAAALALLAWGGSRALGLDGPRDLRAAPAPGTLAHAGAEALVPPQLAAGAPGPVLVAKRPAAPDRSSTKPGTVQVELLVRPFGHVQVDGGAPSREALTAHALLLPPGRHRVRVSCEWCDDVEQTIDVAPGGPQTFALPARLKTAYLSFDFEPRDATVTVAGEQRTAEQSLVRPFALLSPRAATRFVHQVAYVVSHDGYRAAQGTVEVLPGKRETLSGKLEAQ
jgi:serine/threonine-protein kinase